MWGKRHCRYKTPDGGPPINLRPAVLVPIGAGYPSWRPGPFVASISRRGGRPEEVRHVPDNSGVSGRGVDNLALDALPANRVSLYNRPGRGSCARKRRGVPADVAGAPYIRTQGLRPL